MQDTYCINTYMCILVEVHVQHILFYDPVDAKTFCAEVGIFSLENCANTIDADIIAPCIPMPSADRLLAMCNPGAWITKKKHVN